MMYLMSIKPRFAREIFEGYKRFELRRVVGRPPKTGDVLVLYVSGHVQALVGEFVAGRVYRGSPGRLREILGQNNYGISEDHWGYISGADDALAIEVAEARTYPHRVKLSQLRQILPWFNPPYSYCELDPWDPLYQLVLEKLRRRMGRRFRK